MTDRENALRGLAQFLEEAEYKMNVPEDEYRTADYLYGIIYEDNKKAWGDFLSRDFYDWEDLQDYLPRQVVDDITLWGIIR